VRGEVPQPSDGKGTIPLPQLGSDQVPLDVNDSQIGFDISVEPQEMKNMNRRTLLSCGPLFALSALIAPHWLVAQMTQAPEFNPRTNGAVGDGTTLDTGALQRTIDQCASGGGGIVRIDPGTYLTGSLVLRSKVTLHIERGATLLGSPQLSHYQPQLGQHINPEGDGHARHLIFARDAEHIAIIRGGTIDGNGKAFWEHNPRHHAPLPDDAWTDVSTFYWRPLPRPGPMLEFVNCQQLHFEDFAIVNSPSWTLRTMACDSVQIHSVSINNPRFGPNTDGIDITCSSNVDIAGCNITTGDDAICLKSESAYGLLWPVRNITVRKCIIDTNCNGFKIGTGSQTAFENIRISDCDFVSEYSYPGDRMISAIALEVVDGGSVQGLSANNIKIKGARTPFFIRLGNRGWGQNPPIPGTLEDVAISDLAATGALTTSSIAGIPGHLINNVRLKNISISSDEGGTTAWADRSIPEMENAYPESRMFGKLPASGLYCRHARNILVSAFDVQSTQHDYRPALVCDDVADLAIERFRVAKSQGVRPIMDFINVQKAIVRDCIAPAGTNVYLSVQGSQSRNISLRASDLNQARRPVASINPDTVTVQR
jgi:polygalacturonase